MGYVFIWFWHNCCFVVFSYTTFIQPIGLNMNIIAKSAALAAFLSSALVISSTATAGLISETVTDTISFSDYQVDGATSRDGILDFSFSEFSEAARSDVTFTFTARGNLASSNQFIDVSILGEGFTFGNWLNSDESDDIISGSDVGTRYGAPSVGTVIVDKNTFNSWIAGDESLTTRFQYSNAVTNLFKGDIASVSVSYSVPEPTTLLIFGSALTLLASRRRSIK